jgi:hypothetical protein
LSDGLDAFLAFHGQAPHSSVYRKALLQLDHSPIILNDEWDNLLPKMGTSSNIQIPVFLLYINQQIKEKGETEMKTNLGHKSGTMVEKGTYWDLANGQRIDVEQEGILGGEASATYYRIPTGVMLIAGPVIGLFYVISLPFIAIATVATLAAGKVVNGLLSLVGTSLSFEWRPREAYLAGKKKKKDKKESK